MRRILEAIILMTLFVTALILIAVITGGLTNTTKDFNPTVIERRLRGNPELQGEFYKKIRKRDIDGLEQFLEEKE